jgi:hypothetical protein
MPVLNTQSSSKPRLQNDTLGDQALVDLYRVYEKDDFETFRLYAECVVQSGGGKQPMKEAIIAEFYKPLATKTTILTKTQNFILAGMGLGV